MKIQTNNLFYTLFISILFSFFFLFYFLFFVISIFDLFFFKIVWTLLLCCTPFLYMELTIKQNINGRFKICPYLLCLDSASF